MHDIKKLEEAFRKVKQMEFDVDVSISMEKGRLEGIIKMIYKTIRDLSLQKANILCSNREITKDTCRHQVVWVIETQHFYAICQEITQHLTTDCPYNLKNKKQYWCAIYEEETHNTVDWDLNAKNHKVVYKTEVIPNDQGQSTNFKSNVYNPRGRYNDWIKYNGWGGYNNLDQYQNNSTRRPRC